MGFYQYRSRVTGSYTVEDRLQLRKSLVRRILSYAACFYLFFVGPIIMGIAWVVKDFAAAREIFTAILPISSSIIAYWFASKEGDTE